MRIVSQQSIAKQLGLSAGTVSRSLANDPAISEETRARVLQMAQELGYNFARAERRRTTGRAVTIGVIVGVRDSVPGTSTFPFILHGLQDRATAEGLSVEVRFQNPDFFDLNTRGNEVFRQIRMSDWRGAIMIYPFESAAIQAVVRRIPTVVALEDYLDLGVDSIDTDQTSGILLLMEQLVKAGHKRIGFSAWVYPVPGHWTQRRFSAYMEGMFRYQLPFDPEFTINVDPRQPALDKEQISARVAHLVKKRKVTAWVTAADHQAYPLIYDLQRHGLRVPQDCSVTGYDGIAPVANIPQVATIRVPHEEIGGAALRRLIYRMSRPTAHTAKLLLRAELCLGATIGPPPRGS
jgi:LacI family transcriptional regulator